MVNDRSIDDGTTGERKKKYIHDSFVRSFVFVTTYDVRTNKKDAKGTRGVAHQLKRQE